MEQMLREVMLANWSILNRDMHILSEEQILDLINYECQNKKRRVFVERMHQRYTKLRTARERAEILEKLHA